MLWLISLRQEIREKKHVALLPWLKTTSLYTSFYKSLKWKKEKQVLCLYGCYRNQISLEMDDNPITTTRGHVIPLIGFWCAWQTCAALTNWHWYYPFHVALRLKSLIVKGYIQKKFKIQINWAINLIYDIEETRRSDLVFLICGDHLGS